MNTRRLFATAVVSILASTCLAESVDHWTQRSTNRINSVRFCSGFFIAVGPAGGIFTSADGKQWTQQTSGTAADLYGITFGSALSGNFFVAVGDHTILTSLDTTNWTAVAGAFGSLLRDVAFSGTSFVAVGRKYGANTNEANILFCSSPAPTNWLAGRAVPFGPYFSFTNAAFWRVAYGNGQFVAVGDLSTGIWTSSGGTNWVNRGQQGVQYFSGITYANGRFVAVGQEGDPMVSTNDGVSWSMFRVHPMYSYYYFLDDVCFGNGRFVAVDGWPGNVLTSLNGTNWTVHSQTPYLTSIAYGKGTFVAGRQEGGIFQSDQIGAQLSALRRTNGEPVELLLTTEPGQTFGIETSSNLVQWTELVRGTNTGSAIQFVDWSVTNTPSRFYRVVMP